MTVFDPEKYAESVKAMDAETLLDNWSIDSTAVDACGDAFPGATARAKIQLAELRRRLSPAAKVVDREKLATTFKQLYSFRFGEKIVTWDEWSAIVADLIEANAVPWKDSP